MYLGLDLLDSLLAYDSEKRITASLAQRHEYFSEKPYPKDADMMPTFPTQHESMGAEKKPGNGALDRKALHGAIAKESEWEGGSKRQKL